MASFKGIKERINSVKTTRKITSAMKMVSSAKLHKAQKSIAGMLPYSDAMEHILGRLLAAESEFRSPLTEVREPKRVAVIAFSSDSSFAGAYNSNVARKLTGAVLEYQHLGWENVMIYTVGKKVYETAVKAGLHVTRNYEDLAPHPAYEPMAELAAELMEQFTAGNLDHVEVIYHHFRSAGSQVLVHEELLPISLEKQGGDAGNNDIQYIFEPSRGELLHEIIPLTLKLKLYTALLDSNASEHAARVIAMQAATDNADDLIGELTIEYNKSRQQAITNELLDIIGGAGN